MGKQHHSLKTEPLYFQQSWDGDKPFEIRYNPNRQFQKGDIVALKEIQPIVENVVTGGYTGRKITAEITFVTSYKQRKNYVVLGLGSLQKEEL